MSYDLVPGGIVLRDVRHDMFNLAHDIRIVRVWVDTEYSDRSGARDFVLHGPQLRAAAPVTELRESRSAALMSDNPFFFRYHNVSGLQASYRLEQPYLGGTPNECHVDLTQKYLFTNYGKNPAHEPAGVLDACRLFPLLTFWFPAVRNVTHPYPKYFRADYRLDIALDNIAESGLTRAVRTRQLTGTDTSNKAAIFRDNEGTVTFDQVQGAMARLAPFSSSEGAQSLQAAAIFAALEKPLVYEIASWGLARGNPPAGVRSSNTWDNVHIWPQRRSVRSSPISTPGAFHAFHCHWRWGAVAGDIRERGLLLPEAGDLQFTGMGWRESEGGPLIDPNIPEQNLAFAISLNDRDEWRVDGNRNPSERNFASLFTRTSPAPRGVINGGDLIFWVSFEVFRGAQQVRQPWGGTLFVNGFYFAHNQDATPLSLQLGGAYGEAWKPRPRQEWVRLAR